MSIREEAYLASTIWRLTAGLTRVEPQYRGYLEEAGAAGLQISVSQPPVEVPQYPGQEFVCYEPGPRRVTSILFSDGSVAYRREELGL